MECKGLGVGALIKSVVTYSYGAKFTEIFWKRPFILPHGSKWPAQCY